MLILINFEQFVKLLTPFIEKDALEFYLCNSYLIRTIRI